MVRRNSIEASTRSSMVESELIRGSESPYQADLKFLRGCYSRLIHTTEEQSEKCVSMAAILLEVKNTLSQISNQLGIHTIEAESSHQTPPVTFSASYVRDDQNRLPTTDEHTEKFDSMEALLREMKQAPSIEMPEFDASNVSDWLSKVERSFPARRYSDLDRFAATPEASSETVTESLEARASYQVPVSSLEPGLSFSTESLGVLGARPSEIVSNNRVHSQSVLECVKNKANAYQVFDKTSLHKDRLKPKNKRKLSLSLKTWMFKFKNKLLQRKSTSKKRKSLDVKFFPVEEIVAGCEKKLFDRFQTSPSYALDVVNKTSKPWETHTPFTSTPVASVNSLPFAVDNFELCVGHDKNIMRLKLLLHSGCDGEKLPELDFHFGVNHGLLVFPWNLMLLEFLLFLHLEDKVCLSAASNSCYGWMVFDRGKNIIISEDVITLKRDGQKMLLVKVKDAHVDSLVVSFKELWIEIMDGDIAKLLNSTSGKLQSYGYVRVVMFLRRLRVHHRQQKRKFTKAWKFKYKSRLKKIKLTDTSLRTIKFKSREMKQFVGFVKFQVKHKWRLVWRIWKLHNQVVATREVLLFTEMKTLLIAVMMLKLAAKYLGPFQVVELIGVVVYRLQLPLGSKMCDDVFHVSQLKTVIGDHQQVHSSVPPALLEEELLLPEAVIAVRFEDVRRREFLVQWQHCDSSENSWMISQDPVSLYPAFKLEDKLVLRGESIDTIQGLVDDVAGNSNSSEALEGNGGFAVLVVEVEKLYK